MKPNRILSRVYSEWVIKRLMGWWPPEPNYAGSIWTNHWKKAWRKLRNRMTVIFLWFGEQPITWSELSRRKKFWMHISAVMKLISAKWQKPLCLFPKANRHCPSWMIWGNPASRWRLFWMSTADFPAWWPCWIFWKNWSETFPVYMIPIIPKLSKGKTVHGWLTVKWILKSLKMNSELNNSLTKIESVIRRWPGLC